MAAFLLGVLANFSWWLETIPASAFLFGEYPYPEQDEC